MKTVVPKDLYVGFQMRRASEDQPSADGGKHVALGFLTYRNVQGKLQHKESFDNWRDEEIPRIPMDNNPTTGMIAIGFASRYSTSNKYIRIEDPRNFQVEISVENFMSILKQVTMVNGVIQDEMVWGWCNGLQLLKVGADDYLEAKANFDYDGMPTIPIKDVNCGDEVYMSNGKKGIYYGGWHVVELKSWSVDILSYVESGEKKPIKTKRVHIVKIGDSFQRFSSVQVKNVIPGTVISQEDILAEFESDIFKTIKLKILSQKAQKEISELGFDKGYDKREERKVVYNKYGLDDSYSFQGEEFNWYNIFGDFYCISKKPIKQDFFEEYVNKVYKRVWTKHI